MYRAQLTALDTLQHRLARDAQSFHRRPHGEPSAWRLLQEAGPQLVGEPDLPRSAGCELLAADEAILKPAVQRGRRHAQPVSGFGHRYHFAIRWLVRRLITRNVPVLTQARSEEHTSELQSRVDLVCRLLLENKTRNANYLLRSPAPPRSTTN